MMRISVPSLGIVRRKVDLPEARRIGARVIRENMRQIRRAAARGAPLPSLYASGVRYQRERADLWLTIEEIIARGWDDCEGLAFWRVAELRVLTVPAKAVFRLHPEEGLIHVGVKWPPPRPRTEDPSRLLGM